MRALTYIELDISVCSLTHGVPPCMATGETPCLNTVRTCQDRLNYTHETVTLRFSQDTLDLPPGIDSTPCIESVSFTPGTVSLGQDLGTRTSLSVTMQEFRHSDTGPGGDPYWAQRGHDPYTTGTFWARFRARQPYMRGRPIRLIQGQVGQDISEMQVRHLVVESFTGPDTSGRYTLTAKDILKLADGDRSQAPRLSSGFLISDITSSETTALLAPSGIGDAEYPASGLVAIGGREICGFTRSGDALTLTRGLYNTDPVGHEAQDRVQLVLLYDAMSPADIISDLLVNYVEGFDPSWIPLSTWQTEVDTHLRRLYTRVIAEPTDVSRLVSELVEQAALSVWWDDLAQLVQLLVLRSLVPVSDLSEEVYQEGSLTIQDQPNTRVSEVWTYYGQINPLRPVSDPDNYRSARVDVNLQALSDHGVSSIKKIMAAWIPAFASQVAIRVNQLTLSRFSDPPRQFTLSLLRENMDQPRLGSAHSVTGWPMQDALGLPVAVTAQVTRVDPQADMWNVTLEEVTFTQVDMGDLSDRVITIDGLINNVNLRSLHDSIYPEPDPEDPPTLTLIISPGVYIWSNRVDRPALDVGSWPAFMAGRITIECSGIIQGPGGQGGVGKGGDDNPGGTGQAGGTGLRARFPVTLNMSGSIRGGGGGGGGGGGDHVGIFGPDVRGGGGGGGAGRGRPGAGVWPGVAGGQGSLDSGGQGGQNGMVNFGVGTGAGTYAGVGGPPGGGGGAAGGFFPGPGGPGGNAVDGWSYITEGTVTGSYVGGRVN